MYSINERSAYSNSEIALLLKQRMLERSHNVDDLFSIYKIKYELKEKQIIEYMLSGNVNYNLNMIEIASDYLNIPFDELTEILVDDNEISFRHNCDNDCNEFIDLVNYLFSEMIRQEKFNK